MTECSISSTFFTPEAGVLLVPDGLCVPLPPLVEAVPRGEDGALGGGREHLLPREDGTSLPDSDAGILCLFSPVKREVLIGAGEYMGQLLEQAFLHFFVHGSSQRDQGRSGQAGSPLC